MELSFSFPFFPPKSRDTIHTLARLAPGRKYIPHTGYAHHSFWGLPPPLCRFSRDGFAEKKHKKDDIMKGYLIL